MYCMWTKEMFGTDVYHLVSWFIMYSMLGWLIESIYMSFCNRKLTNRGFAKSPFCPIYGFGAVGAYLMLRPLEGDYVKLYLCGSMLATLFEFFVAKLMIRLFGEVWWDYNEKPYNYKGIICLESTVAWGFYTVFLFLFLHKFVMAWVESYSYYQGIFFCKMILTIFSIDFFYHFFKALHFNFSECREKMITNYREFRARF